jgi:hypothetical protein
VGAVLRKFHSASSRLDIDLFIGSAAAAAPRFFYFHLYSIQFDIQKASAEGLHLAKSF